MFFNTQKYKEDVERKRKRNLSDEPSKFNMISLAILASIPITRPLLKLHRKKIDDTAQIEPKKGQFEQIPIIYFHGFRGGDYTTAAMIKQALKDKKTDKYLKVTVDLLGNFKLEGTWSADEHPLVQIVLRQRMVTVYALDYYLSFILPFLAKRYHFSHYTAVAHSLACPCIVRIEMKKSNKRNFPHLNKCAFIAGPFDGVTYLGDIPNVNLLNKNGRPSFINPHYLYLMLHRRRFDPDISVLNIYGNILNNTNTDNYISVISAKSIRYILAPKAHSYREVEIRGREYAEHSIMHDNHFVINIVNQFVGIKK